MAMSRSLKCGSDEDSDKVSDICCYCANKSSIQTATSFCYDCGVFGRYLCDSCLQSHNMFVGGHDVTRIGSLGSSRVNAQSRENRTLDEIKKKLSDLKSGVKKRVTDRCRLSNQTGGGPAPILLEWEEKMLVAIGEVVVNGFARTDTFQSDALGQCKYIRHLDQFRFEENDREMNELEGKVKNLEAEKNNLNEKLNREIAEGYDRQKVLMGLEKQAQESHAENTKLNTDIDDLRKANRELEAKISKVEEAFIEVSKEKEEQNKDFQKAMANKYKRNQKQTDAMKGDHERKVCTLREKMSEIVKERDGLKTRISERDKKLEKLDGDIILLHKQLKEADERANDSQNIAERLKKQAQEAHSENSQLKSKVDGLCKANGVLLANSANMEEELTKGTEQYKNYQKYMEMIYKANQKQIGAIQEDHGRKVRTLSEKLSMIVKERDDLKTRFSKLAGANLTDQNADIADLSDPNRAMKVSEKFGQLFDDEWTDAFEELKKKKVPVKDCIQFLLRILQESLEFCNNLKETQMRSLNNVLLHPSEDVSKFVRAPRTNVGGLKEMPRISSKNEKAVRDLRRQIGVNDTCLDEVKQVFVIETRSWDKKGYDKKHLELCMPYIQKCAEICWLMVLHDPPLHMKMDAKNGDKMDSNFYTVYSSSGDKIDFLVWPPLFNEAGGGLITKGVAECLRTVKKK